MLSLLPQLNDRDIEDRGYSIEEQYNYAELNELLIQNISKMPPQRQLIKRHVDDEAAARAAFQQVASRLGFTAEARNTTACRSRLAAWSQRIAAILIVPLLCAVCLLYATRQPEVEWFEKQVPYGEIASLTLPDGTHLHLNSGSRITYPSAFTGKERRIFVDGEIFADVAKDPHKPFIIRSGDVGIRVLGTKFNFKSYTNTDCIELLLVDGAVQFDIDTDTRKQQLRMEPGDLVLYDRVSNDINLSTFQPEHFKSFADNRAIHFFNLRMHDIALDLERLFGTRIVILDEALAQTRYFAYFTNNETLDQILSAINSDRKMKISRRDGVVYLSLK